VASASIGILSFKFVSVLAASQPFPKCVVRPKKKPRPTLRSGAVAVRGKPGRPELRRTDPGLGTRADAVECSSLRGS